MTSPTTTRQGQAHWLPVVAFAAVFAVLASAAAMARHGRMEAEARAQGQRVAALFAQRLEETLADTEHALFAARLGTDGAASLWHLSNGIWRPTRQQDDVSDISGQLLRKVDAGKATNVIQLHGPFMTLRGDVLLFMTLTGTHLNNDAVGEFIELQSLLRHADIRGVTQQGYQVSIDGNAPLTGIYNSDLTAMIDPVTAAITRPAPGLRVQIAARNGWVPQLKTLPLLIAALVLSICAATYHAYLLRRPRDLAGQLDRANDLFTAVDKRLTHAVRELEELRRTTDSDALHDPVTGLQNRTAALAGIDHLLAQLRRRTGKSATLLVIGIGNLTRLTNVYGHVVQGKLLFEIAKRLRTLEQLLGEPCAISEHHFSLTIADGEQRHEGHTDVAASTVLARLHPPFEIDQHRIHLDIGIGMARIDSGYEYADELLDRALLAMTEALTHRDNPVCVFEPRTIAESADRLQLEGELLAAFNNNEFHLFYEPILDAAAGEIVGVEALIRWNHPRLGWVPPVRFLGMARDLGLQGDLDRWVLATACRQAGIWHALAPRRPFFIDINITPESFLQPGLVENVARHLAEQDIPGELIRLEIVEGTVVRDLNRATEVINALKEIGINVWLDDFGTGYSSLSYLLALPFHGVKLDRSFITQITFHARDYGFVKGLVDLMHYLGMGCIAEGIETRGQLELIELTGCDLCQGYLFHKAMPEDQVRALMFGEHESQRLPAAKVARS